MKKYIQLSDSVKIEYEQLSNDKALSIIQSLNGRMLTKYSVGDRTAFILDNNEVVIMYETESFLYNSENDIQKLLQGPKTRNILNGHNPYGERFPEKSDSLILDLLLFLDQKRELIVYSEELLKKIDAQIVLSIDSKMRKVTDFHDYTLHFIALAGEVYIRSFGGEWKMIKDSDGTWQPYILFEGKLIDLFVWIYDSINDIEDYPSVYNGYKSKTFKVFKG